MSEDFVQHGKRLLQKREFGEVVRVCRLGLLSRPGLVDGRLLLGTALLALRRYEEVLAEMRVAGELDRSNVLVHLLRGEAFLRKGESEEAVQALARAVEIDPQNPVARKLYGEARHRAGLDERPTPSPAGSRELVPIAAPAPEEPAVEEPPPAAPIAPAPEPPRRRRTGLIVAVAAALLLAVVGGGGIYYLRSSRQLAQRLASLRTEADRAAAEQTYRGYQHARELYADMARGGDKAAAGAAARLRAATAYEFGVRLPDENQAAGAGRDAQLAAVYQTLAAGDAATGVKQATALETAFPEDAEVEYVAGRARLLLREAGGIDALRRSLELSPTPLAHIALGEAEAAAGHAAEALRSLDAALALSPGHPGATIARARLLAAAGQLPRPVPAVDSEPDRTLLRLASGGTTDVAPSERHLAALALTEVKLARGDVSAAKAALVMLGGAETTDVRFGEAAVAIQLAAGDPGAARGEAEKWRAALPGSGTPHVWLARTALLEENLEGALVELGKAGDAADSFGALVARGEASLIGGDLAAATVALDHALTLRGGDRTAQLLRSRIDLDTGDAAAAEARLTPLYEAGRDPVVAALLGEALRRRGDRSRARLLLEEATLRLQASSGRPAALATASMALARLDHEEGRFADAQQAVSQVLALRPQDIAARLLGARLRFDLGDAAGARLDLDTLAVAAHTDAQVLLAAARVHLATRDPAGARQLLDEAAKLPGVAAQELTRESARLALAEGRPLDAADLLAGGDRDPGDGESWLLLLDAQLAAPSSAGDLGPAERTVGEIAHRFPGKAEEHLAAGRMQLARREGETATASYAAALARLESSGAPPRVLSDVRARHGQAQELAGRGDDALLSYREAARLDPSAAGPSYLLGRMLFAKGDAVAGLEALSRAVKLDPGLAEAHFHLGEAAAALKKTPVARQAFETYLKLAPRGPLAERAQKMLGGM